MNDTTAELRQPILSLICDNIHTDYGLTTEIYEKFIAKLREEFPVNRVPLILEPINESYERCGRKFVFVFLGIPATS